MQVVVARNPGSRSSYKAQIHVRGQTFAHRCARADRCVEDRTLELEIRAVDDGARGVDTSSVEGDKRALVNGSRPANAKAGTGPKSCETARLLPSTVVKRMDAFLIKRKIRAADLACVSNCY
jgi:hypothetical protein